MQIINSLLNLSASADSSRGDPSVYRNLSRRIQSMASVHDQFYGSPDASRIDFTDYLKRLVADLQEGRSGAGSPPEVRIEADEASLTLEKAIPAGLILSELLENAFRFAFPGGRGKGIIRVEQKKTDAGGLRISVRDEGPGFPKGFDPAHPATLGLELIRILSEQLHGSVVFRNEGGAVATLSFPLGIRKTTG
jgi:two-component sensor histidine kinase